MNRLQIVQISQQIINLTFIAGMKWERNTLYVHLVGGRYHTFVGEAADKLWDLMSRLSINMDSGEPVEVRD